jgi:Vacuolar protein sorting-associated protein 62
MKKWIALAAFSAMVAGCSDASQPLASAPSKPHLTAWGVDNDHDGLDDGIEDELANRFAPVLYMPNLISRADAGNGVAGDWTWPANVEWYLQNTQLRFHHANCPDHAILSLGAVTTTNLITQSHQRATSWLGCSHSGTTYSSSGGGGWSTDNHFFLQAVYDDVTHPGVRDASGWKVYVHAYPNSGGGVNLQYWFFYAYNDFVSSANHEADWEHITVRLNASQQVDSIYYGQHTGEKTLYPYQVTWYGTTHPQVWVGDGSHASYPSEGECDATINEGMNQSCWSNLDQRWFTWSGGQAGAQGLQGGGLVNLGEMPQAPTLKRAMPGQEWISYSGRWGEVGNVEFTSGPRSPGYQTGFWPRD